MPGPELTPLSKAMSRLPDGRSVSRRPDRLLAEPVGPECPPDSRVISEAPTPGVPGTQYRNPTASHVFHAMAGTGAAPGDPTTRDSLCSPAAGTSARPALKGQRVMSTGVATSMNIICSLRLRCDIRTGGTAD